MSYLITLGILVLSLGMEISARSAPLPDRGEIFSSQIEIDRIDITGVEKVPTQTIEGALEISPGDRLEKLKVLRTEENLQKFYRAHGYEQMSVRSRLIRKKSDGKNLETILEFNITEGNPTRIAQISWVPESILDEKARKNWNRRVAQLNEVLNIEVGSILDQEKITDSKRSIQELLASEEYMGARVVRVQVDNTTSAPLLDKLHSNQSAVGLTAKWVTLSFHIDLGDRVRFGFRGNTVFTVGYLSAIVEEQRLLGLGRDYINLIKERLESEYLSQGYARVEITSYTVESPLGEERKVTYIIREGPRVKIESLVFDGNSIFSGDELREKFFSKASALVQQHIYVEKDIQKASELLIEWLKEQGYLSAKIVTINSTYLPVPRTQQANSQAKVTVYIFEGDQTIVRNFEVSGANLITATDIKKIFRVNEGAPLNLFALEDGIESIKKFYRDRGYLSFRILNEGTESLVHYSQENRVADISLQLDEGMQYRVGRIEVAGLVKTKEFIVRRELTFHEGEILGESQLLQSERQLKKLGIFSNVSMSLVNDSSKFGVKTVRINLREDDRGILTWGPGLRNDLGVRVFGQLSYMNLWGENHTASVNLSANRRFSNYQFVEGQLQFSYLWPWFGMSGLNFRPSLAGGRTQYLPSSPLYTFSADTVTATASWDKPLFSNPRILGSLSYTLEQIDQFRAALAINENTLRLGTVSPRLSLDLRDNPLVPTTGFFSTVWMDVAIPTLGSDFDKDYYRVQMRSDYHLPLFRSIGLFLSFRTGFERRMGGAAPIPTIKQFTLGGVGSLRGYQEQELSLPNISIYGSLNYVNYRSQIDLPFSGALKFGVFLDAANLLVDSYSFGGLSYGTGAGFHYQTPVGPVNFDWGFKINPQPGADTNVLHFSVGVI